MKVIHIISALNSPDVDVALPRFFSALQAKGVESQIVSMSLPENLQFPNIVTHRFDIQRSGIDWSFFGKALKLVGTQKPDVIHSYGARALLYGSLISLLTGRPSVHTFGEFPLKKIPSFFVQLNKIFIAPSEFFKNNLIKSGYLDLSKLKVIHAGILGSGGVDHSESAKKAVRKDLKIGESTFVLGYVAAFSKEKDQETLLKAFRNLIVKEFDGVLILAGAGAMLKDLERIAEELGVKESVRFVEGKNYQRLLPILDIAVDSSFDVLFPRPILEAMSLGVPVVVTKVGAHTEIIEDGRSGIWVPCGFPERIEAAVMRLFVNRELLKTMGGESQKRFFECFSLEQMVDKYFNCYRSFNK